MDEGHTRPVWPSHSYENIYYRQEYYESVVMSSQTVDQTSSISTLIHKVSFAYQCLRTPNAAMVPGCAGVPGRCSAYSARRLPLIPVEPGSWPLLVIVEREIPMQCMDTTSGRSNTGGKCQAPSVHGR
jgi:hypothetical protein